MLCSQRKNPSPKFIENCRKAGFYSSPVVGTEKAFVTYEAFVKYAKYFTEEAKFSQNDCSVLVMDGLNSHTLNLEALKIFQENQTLAVSIPSHTSHVFNVGDRTVFGLFKRAWREEALDYRREIKANITVDDFPLIFRAVWNKTVIQRNIISGIYFIFI